MIGQLCAGVTGVCLHTVVRCGEDADTIFDCFLHLQSENKHVYDDALVQVNISV